MTSSRSCSSGRTYPLELEHFGEALDGLDRRLLQVGEQRRQQRRQRLAATLVTIAGEARRSRLRHGVHIHVIVVAGVRLHVVVEARLAT